MLYTEKLRYNKVMNVGNSSKYIKYLFATVFALMILSTGSVSVFTGNQTTDFSVTNTAHAQEGTTYTFMQNVDLPGFGGSDGTITVSDQSFATYVNGLIQVAIGFAILLSVIMVIAGGAEYMGARSVTNKDDAQDRIGKAIGGLLLALSAVVILQTINPNLVELNPLGEVNVEGEDISTPDFGEMGVTFNPDDTGLYYCFAHDSWGANDYACAETQNQCEDAKEVDNKSYSDCRRVVYYEGAYDEARNATACYATYSGGGDPTINQYGVNCFSSESQCTNSREDNSSIPETPTPETECKAPAEFGTSGNENVNSIYRSEGVVVDNDGNTVAVTSGLGVPNSDSGVAGNQMAESACQTNGEQIKIQSDQCDGQCSVNECGSGISQTNPDKLLEDYVINGNPSETDVRQLFANQNPTIYTNRGGENNPRDGEFCQETGDNECTNLGGLSQEARNNLFEFNQNFADSSYYCGDDCKLVVTGGTSWFFHGNQKENPAQTINGNTCHNPVGISSGLCTRAVDLRKQNNLDNYIADIGECAALADNEYIIDNHWFYDEGDHWHITFDKYPGGCSSLSQ